MNPTPSTTEGVSYRPGIDGVRALAVVAVVLYHADISWLPAGFLGVDVFFAISGYLICTLLLVEWDATGHISLRRFWTRRARRLLPALGALLVGATVLAAVVAPDGLGRLRGDVPAAAGYVSNWWQIARGQSYFEMFGRPPLLRHLWSLAVEEQFYLAFPLVLVVALRCCRRRRWPIAVGALVAGAASTVLMALLWKPDADPTRVYYGSDTRAVCLCAGVALALLWSPVRMHTSLGRLRRVTLDLVGVCGLAALVLLMVRLNDYGSALYQGGFAVTAVASCMVIAVVAHPASRLGVALGWQPMRWIGTRSYAIYLWHWPVFAVTRPHLDMALDGWQLLTLRLALTAVLAELSWQLVERPFRTGAVRRWWRGAAPWLRWRTAFAGAIVTTLGLTALLAVNPVSPAGVLASGTSTAPGTTQLLEIPAPTAAAPTQALPPLVETTTAETILPLTTTATSASPPSSVPASRPTAVPSGPARAAPLATTSPQPPASPPPPRPAPGPPDGSVLAIGDSVMVGAKTALTAGSGGRIYVDAAVGRHVADGLDILQRYRDHGDLANVVAVVIHLGTNGPFTAAQFDRMANIVAGVPRVVVLNVRVPKRWEAESNATVGNGVPKHPAMRMGDWHAVSGQRGVIGDDGVHPTPSGGRVYANLVLQQLQPPIPAPPTTATTMPPPPPPTTTSTTPPPTVPAPPPPSTTTTTEPPSTTTTTASEVSPVTTAPGDR